MFEILYKKTKSNQIQQWQIIVENDTFYTIEGIKGGVLTKSQPTKCEEKNVGKLNHRSANNQAIAEAQSRYDKKISSGYGLTIETSGKKFFEVMLAHDYEKYRNLLFSVPTFIQPKLDGVRCYMGDSKLSTRNGKPIVSCPHLNLGYEGIDGELYNHKLKDDFNKIISLVRKTKPESKDLEESRKLIQFWAYDYPFYSDLVFSERYAKLEEANLYNVILVPTYQVESEREVQMYHHEFLSEGFEGSIIRMDLGPYEGKRSKQLLKYKDWKDEEFEILDILPGVGNRSDCGNIIQVSVKGKTCGVTTTGSTDFMRDLLKNKSKYIGKKATVKFFGYTEDGMLRFPTLKSIRDYE